MDIEQIKEYLVNKLDENKQYAENAVTDESYYRYAGAIDVLEETLNDIFK